MSASKVTNFFFAFPCEENKHEKIKKSKKKKSENWGRWTEEEHHEFVKCVLASGTLNWKNVIKFFKSRQIIKIFINFSSNYFKYS